MYSNLWFVLFQQNVFSDQLFQMSWIMGSFYHVLIS